MSTDADRRDRLQLVVTGLGTLLVMSLVALLVVTLLWRSAASGGDLTDAGRGAEKAARAAVVSMTTYDYRTVDQDFAWVQDAGTTKFQDQYTEVSEPIKKLVTELKATATGTVVASAPEVKDAHHVTVLLFVDQRISNPGSGSTPPQKGLDQPRVTMDMVLRSGRWLVDEVQLSSLSQK